MNILHVNLCNCNFSVTAINSCIDNAASCRNYPIAAAVSQTSKQSLRRCEKSRQHSLHCRDFVVLNYLSPCNYSKLHGDVSFFIQLFGCRREIIVLLRRNLSFVSLVIIAKKIRQNPRTMLNVRTSCPRMTEIAVPNTDSSVSITAA